MYLFAGLRQLPALAPHIPTRAPRLRQTAYEMVLHAFLLAPGDHGRLLAALRAWPPDLFSVPSLTQSVLQRCAAGPRCFPFLSSFSPFSFLLPVFFLECHDALRSSAAGLRPRYGSVRYAVRVSRQTDSCVWLLYLCTGCAVAHARWLCSQAWRR